MPDMNLPLTARTLAALIPGMNLGQVQATPTYVPTAQDAQIPGFPGGMLPPGSPAGDLADTQPDLMAALPLLRATAQAKAAAMSQPAAAPAAAAAPGQSPLLRILSAIVQGGQVALADDPGAALTNLIATRQQNANRAQDQQRQERLQKEAEQRDFERQLLTIGINEDVAGRREARADKRQQDAEYRQFQNEQKRILGDQAFRSNEAEIQRMFEEKKLREGERIADERQAKQLEAARNKEIGDNAKVYIGYGASPTAARRIAAALFDGTELNPADDRVLKGIQAKIDRAQRAAAGGGGRTPKPDNATYAIVSDAQGNRRAVSLKDLDINQNTGEYILPPGFKVVDLQRGVSGEGGPTVRPAAGAQGAPGAGSAGQAGPSMEALQSGLSARIAQARQQGMTFGQTLNELRDAPRPDGVSPADWRNLKSAAVREVQRVYGYGQKAPAVPVAPPSNVSGLPLK